MKSTHLILVLMLSPMAQELVFAADPVGTSGSSNFDEKHPCKAVEAACEAAGFVKGGYKEGSAKGVWKDCFKPLMAGAPVAGVNVSQADIQACQARKAKHVK